MSGRVWLKSEPQISDDRTGIVPGCSAVHSHLCLLLTVPRSTNEIHSDPHALYYGIRLVDYGVSRAIH